MLSALTIGIFLRECTDSFHRHVIVYLLLSNFYLLGTVLDSKNITGKQQDMAPALKETV